MKSLFLIGLFLFFSFAEASPAKIEFGEVKVIQGDASRGSGHLQAGEMVFDGDTVTTGKKSLVRIKLADGSGAFQVGPGSSVKLSLGNSTTRTIDLLQGLVLSTIKPTAKPSEKVRYRVRTTNVSMGVRGTTFFARADGKDRTFQCICEGHVESEWKNGKEVWESKHHESRHFFTPEKAEKAAMNLPTNHTDEEIAELKKLLD